MAALKTPASPKREGARQSERKATGRRRDVGNERLLRHRALPLPVFGRPFGTYIPVGLLSRGFALLHHLPVILTPLRGFTQKNLYARSSAILSPFFCFDCVDVSFGRKNSNIFRYATTAEWPSYVAYLKARQLLYIPLNQPMNWLATIIAYLRHAIPCFAARESNATCRVPNGKVVKVVVR